MRFDNQQKSTAPGQHLLPIVQLCVCKKYAPALIIGEPILQPVT